MTVPGDALQLLIDDFVKGCFRFLIEYLENCPAINHDVFTLIKNLLLSSDFLNSFTKIAEENAGFERHLIASTNPQFCCMSIKSKHTVSKF